MDNQTKTIGWTAQMERPESPCVSICTLDDNNVCLGCHRTMLEIQQWTRLSPAEQWSIVNDRAPARAEELSH